MCKMSGSMKKKKSRDIGIKSDRDSLLDMGYYEVYAIINVQYYMQL